MAIIRGFKALRPVPEYASRVASPPYDVLTSDEAREQAGEFSFLHVVKSEIDLPTSVDIYSDAVYEKARENLDNMAKKGILMTDESPCLYIYRLTRDGMSQTGLVACVSVDEYLSGVIKKHELTIEAKEQDRMRHIDATDANTGPVFMAYRSSAQVKGIMSAWIANANIPAVYDFIADDDVSHEVWVIDCDEVINQLVECFAAIPNLYIADGHHRNASTAKVCQERRREDNNPQPDAEYNFYMSVIFPDDELNIMDYNRLVKDLNGYSKGGFLDELNKKWRVSPIDDTNAKPINKHTYGMYLDGGWYRLEAKQEIIPDSIIDSLDVALLQNEILSPLLGIGDPRTDKRVDFVGGRRGIEELKRRVDSGEMSIAFAMYPTSMGELFSVADAGDIMPPKSTWFEPKLRSGLFVHRLS